MDEAKRRYLYELGVELGKEVAAAVSKKVSESLAGEYHPDPQLLRYKCRLCGEEFNGPKLACGHPESVLCTISSGRYPQHLNLVTRMHIEGCRGEDVGLGDLIGVHTEKTDG